MRSEASSSSDDFLPAALARVRRETSLVPEVAIILGSGLGPLADEIEVEAIVPYEAIPGMNPSTAPGHSGKLYLGNLQGRPVVAMKGRIHLYDGVSAAEIGFPVRLMHELGAEKLVVSNACGGLDPSWQAGDLMLHRDFINATGTSALLGPNDDDRGPRFPVMFDCYDPAYSGFARKAAERLNITLREGVYLAISGPAYATRAELRAYRQWGADVIGMSTVHEVTVARHEGVRVLGLSCITDMALPEATEHVSGDEVVRMAERSGEKFRRLVRALLPEL